jgi:hypothetical protein
MNFDEIVGEIIEGRGNRMVSHLARFSSLQIEVAYYPFQACMKQFAGMTFVTRSW